MIETKLFLTACLSLALIRSAQTATRAVINTNDNFAGSLRQTTQDASPGDTINFAIPKNDPGYDSSTNTWTVTLTSAELAINKSLTIDAAGERIVVRRKIVNPPTFDTSFRIFHITTTPTVTFVGLTISNGLVLVDGGGGGILNADGGIVNVVSCAIIDNSVGYGASSAIGSGGGIENASSGTIRVSNSTFSNNTAGGDQTTGGAISNHSGTLNVNNSTFNNNGCRSLGDGGAIGNGGIADITGSVFSNNSAGNGGAISNSGTLTVTKSTFVENSTIFGSGGAIIIISGAAAISTSTLSGNSCLNSYGGGIAVESNGTVSIVNCTISGNSTGNDYQGGGIWNAGGTVNLNGSTVAHNTSTAGGGVANGFGQNHAGTFNVKSTIVALNAVNVEGPDVAGFFISDGYNLIGKTNVSVGFTAVTDHTGTVAAPLNPDLSPRGLQQNGGPTKTIALLSSSVAINKGAPDAPARDQRNYLRYNSPEIGAYEFSGTIPARLGNISTRGFVQTTNNVLIGGLIVTGGGSKRIILRALGPTLGQPPFNLPNTLTDPVLELHDSRGAMIISNDNWANASNAQAISTSGYAPPNNSESAILTNLTAGNYTAIVRGVNTTVGIALFDAFDLDDTMTASIFGNISTRAFVGTEGQVMIAGVIVQGPDSENVVMRGLGPTLSEFGVPNVLQDPFLDLRDGNGNAVITNDNWKSSQQSEIRDSGYAPPNDFESAISVTLAPGNYTAILSGKNNGTGNALVEVYGLN